MDIKKYDISSLKKSSITTHDANETLKNTSLQRRLPLVGKEKKHSHSHKESYKGSLNVFRKTTRYFCTFILHCTILYLINFIH